MADFNYTGGVRFAPDKVVDVTADKDGNPTKACNPVTGVCLEGGGGDSDFSTAEVTFKSNISGVLTAPLIENLPNIATGLLGDEALSAEDFKVTTTEKAISVVLYKGVSLCGVIIPSDNYIVTDVIVSGGVTVDDNRYLAIEGDGTCEIVVEAES